MRDILICGDIFRANLELTHRPYNTRWFSALIRQGIAPLGMGSEVLGYCPPVFSFEQFYKSIYQKAGDSVLDKWAQLYDAKSFDHKISAQLFEIFSNKIIILFEGSRSVLSYISTIGGVYLNFRVSPLRFASDLVFIIESNDANVQLAIRQFELKATYVEAQIAALRTQLTPSIHTFDKPTLIFLGQVRGDASLIHEGRFAKIKVPDSLDPTRFGRDAIYHKPHPIDANEPEIERWKTCFPTSQHLDLPTYAAFCGSRDITFVSVSSGAGYEAQLLGHPCYFVSPHNWAIGAPAWARFTSVLYEYWFEGFWRAIFNALDGKPLDKARIADEQRRMHFAPDRLRDTIDAEWSQRSPAIPAPIAGSIDI